MILSYLSPMGLCDVIINTLFKKLNTLHNTHDS